MDTPETSRESDPGTKSSIDYNPSADNSSGRRLEELVDELDAETLEQRRHARSTTDAREMKRCPACGSVKLHRKTGGPSGTRKPGDYRCDGCQHHFDEPVVDDEDELVTDGGEALSESLKTALENADCHPDMVRYAEKAAERGGTPILSSLRRFHDVSDVSRIETVGTQIERSLWKDGAEATLRRHGHVDETNTEILQEIVEQQPVTDGGQPAGLDEAELRIRTARANIAGLIPIFGMGIQTAQKVGALEGPARQMVSQIYDELEAEYPEADRREDLLDAVFHTNKHGGSWVPLVSDEPSWG